MGNQSKPKTKVMTKKVLSVMNVTFEILEKTPPTLVIKANGTVNSSGWLNAKLNPFIYVVPPIDGIYEFDFVANKPTGIVLEVITAIHSKPFFWDNFPSDLKGIKVYAETDDITVKL